MWRIFDGSGGSGGDDKASALLDGINDYLQRPTWTPGASLNTGTVSGNDSGTESFSVSAWVKPGWSEGEKGSQTIISWGSGDLFDTNLFRLYFTNGNSDYNKIVAQIATNDGSTMNETKAFWSLHDTSTTDYLGDTIVPNSTATGLNAANTWSTAYKGNCTPLGFVNLVMVFTHTKSNDSGVNLAFDLYWNGLKLLGSNDANFSMTGGPSLSSSVDYRLRIGALWYQATQTLTGNIDEVGIWDKALSAAEIAEIWGGTVSAGETDGVASKLTVTPASAVSDLEGAWNMDNTWNDQSTNAQHLDNEGPTFDTVNYA